MTTPKLRSPIVLVHGLFGFDQLRLAGLNLADYFPAIPATLDKAGNRVYVPCLSPTRGVAERAEELKKYLDKHLPHEPVHIVAHSMGGLDARYMISKLGMADRVLTLTTLGTPHHGTAVADWSVRNLERLVKPVMQFLNIPTQAFYDLTTHSCRTFNEKVVNAEKVRYFSVAGEHTGSFHRPEWLFPYAIVLHAEGPNDGVVSVKSATHGELLTTWQGDHFSLVNWTSLFFPPAVSEEGVPLFNTILKRLADEGY